MDCSVLSEEMKSAMGNLRVLACAVLAIGIFIMVALMSRSIRCKID